jgi:hypothetical protein
MFTIDKQAHFVMMTSKKMSYLEKEALGTPGLQ